MNALARRFSTSLYRIAQRCIILDVTKLLVKDFGDGIYVGPTGNLHCGFLSQDELMEHARDPTLGIDPQMVSRVESGFDECVAAMDGNKVVGYFWAARGGIEAEHNRGDHPLTGVAVSFGEDTAFIYKAFARSSYRGRRIFPSLLCYASNRLEQDEGITRLISTTDWTNDAALAAFRRTGFYSIGHVFRFVIGKPMTLFPSAVKQFNISLGDEAVVPERWVNAPSPEPACS